MILHGYRTTSLAALRPSDPETFAFLCFVHCCRLSHDGRFIAKHKTEGKCPTRQLKELREAAWRYHTPLAVLHKLLPAVCAYTRSISKYVASGSVAFGDEVRKVGG